jgi:multidrug transporter EmrE-like cation transporter
MTAGVSICAMTYTIIGFRIMKNGNMAIYTLFLMSGGTVLPYLFGLIFLGEQVSVLRIIGIVLIILAIVLSNLSKEKLDFKMLLSCIAVFILNGVLGIFSSLNQKGADLYGFETIDSYSFIVYGNLVKIVVSLVALAVLFISQKLRKNDASEEKIAVASANEKTVALDKKTLVIIALTIVASAAFDGIGYLLQLTALPHLPASVQYPFLTGGSMIATTLAGILFFRDKPKKMTLISIALCFVSLFLFLEF